MRLLLASKARLSRGSLYQRAWLHSSPALLAKTLQKFKLADIGEGITECEVLRWSVKIDAPVEAFDQLLEVQSDKASVEITSPFDGIVKELLVPEGSVAKVGQVLCTIEVDDGVAASTESSLVEPVVASPSKAEETPSQISHSADRTELSSEKSQSATLNDYETPLTKRRHHPMDPNRPAATSSNHESVLATPAIRHFARSKGVDLSTITPGSGKDGRIEKQDIEAILSQGVQAPKTASPSANTSFVPTPSSSEDTIVELGRTRYGMWKAMERSLAVPHFGYTTSLDLTRLHALLPTLNAHIPSHYQLISDNTSARPALVDPSALHPSPSPPDVPAHARFAKLTYLPILLKTLSKAMHAWPLFRSSLISSSSESDKPRLAVRPHADIALALSTPSGLYTPVLQAVDTHSVYSLSSRIADLAYRGRQIPSGLTPTDMPRSGATISVSNVGAIGRGEAAMPVLVPGGGVAIVALGRAQWGLEVQGEKDEPVRRLRLPVSWAADHRIVEGAEMAAFVEEWRGWVENPERLIAEGI